mgnify:FL=1
MFEIFYNQAVRKITVAFGSLFNNIYVTRLNADGTTERQIRVPLGYGPKQKYIRRLEESSSISDDANDVQITLPRLAFNMTGVEYDSARKKNTLQRRFIEHGDNSKTYTNYSEVPYNFTFQVSAMVKFMEDGLCIMEQILPYFTPEFTITINFNDINQKVDIPVVLGSVTVNEEYEGDFDARRMITFDMEFTAKAHIYGNTKSSNIIQTTTSTIWNLEELLSGGGISGPTGAQSKITVGVTGPSGASSGIGNFTGYETSVSVYGGPSGSAIDEGGNDT